MLELTGKYATAKVFTDVVDNESISQVINLLNQPFAQNQTIRMMPDIHAGAGCTIGTTMTITNKVCPNLVGVDIGCGMYTAKIDTHGKPDLDALDNALQGNNQTPIVPSGFEIRTEMHPLARKVDIGSLRCFSHINHDRARNSIGTLGGGNHFIEIDKDPNDNSQYLIVHTGSRHLGVEIANYYQKQAIRQRAKPPIQSQQEIIDSLKAEGHPEKIQKALRDLKATIEHIPDALAYCDGTLLDDYLHDMKLAQQFAQYNRLAIIQSICTTMHWDIIDQFETIHNYIDTDAKILRKGAVSAQKNETLLIPINMRDGSLICKGKGNPDWNYSAPHGAGRLMSRSKAKEAISMKEFQESMSGIYTTSVNEATLDESPMAYKSIDSIIDNIGPTVDIMCIIKPIYNFKAGN